LCVDNGNALKNPILTGVLPIKSPYQIHKQKLNVLESVCANILAVIASLTVVTHTKTLNF